LPCMLRTWKFSRSSLTITPTVCGLKQIRLTVHISPHHKIHYLD
jgi:hypothetical protein